MTRKLWFWGITLFCFTALTTGSAFDAHLFARGHSAAPTSFDGYTDADCTVMDSLAYSSALHLYDTIGAGRSIRFIQQYLTQREAQACPDTRPLGDIWHKYGVFLYLTDQYRLAEQAYTKAIQIRTALLGEQHLDVARSYHNLGVALKEKGDYINALPPLKKAAALRQAAEAPDGVADSYFEQAAVYNAMGEYNIALEYLHAALPVFQQHYGERSYEAGQTFNEMGIARWNLGEYQQALARIKEAQSVFRSSYGPMDTDVALTHVNLGNIYDDLGVGERAIREYQKAISIYQHHEGYDLSLGLAYNNLGVTLRKLKRFPAARQALEQSLTRKNQALGEGPHPNKAATLDNIGDLYLDMEDYEAAIQLYQQAIYHRVPGFTDTLGYSNPAIRATGIRGSWQKLLVVMASKAKTLKALHRQTKKQIYLEESLAAYYTCEQIVVQLQQQYETRKSKLFLQENAVPIYEHALETCFLLQETADSAQYIEDAFFFIEQSRATLLTATLQEAKAKTSGGIPPEVQAEEQGFRANIGYLESKISLAANGQNQERLQKELADLRHQLQLFTAELENKYPAYFREKYRTPKASTVELELFLAERASGWVAYFAGEKQSYALCWDGRTWRLSALPPRAAWEPLISDLVQALSQQQHDLPLENYKSTAYPIYTTLWAPLGNTLPERIFVSPAGAIHSLPLSILPTSTQGRNWKEIPYLLQQQQISYAYSAAVLLQQENRTPKHSAQSFLGLAPTFEAASGLAPLSYNQQEVTAIQEVWKGKALIGKQATKRAFLSLAEDFQVLHLSTHASAADGGWIAFSTQGLDSKLYLSELYPLNLSAELIVLSACETASGQLARGEGVMSLARGLSYAGCPSTVAALWPVLQGSTSKIMLAFYSHLKDGRSKDEALRKAQLDYLSNEETDLVGAHPAIWGSFLHLGTPRPIAPQHGLYSWWWLFGSVLIATALFLLGRAFLRRAQ